MSRPPRVLHVVRDWVRPSEGFVADVVRSSRTTVPVVAYGRRWPELPVPDVPSTRLDGGDRVLRARLRLLVRRRRISLLHSHFGYWAHLTGPVARATGRPWTVALHGHDALVEGDPHRVLPSADLVIVPSQFLADAVTPLGVRDEQLRVVPAGLDLDALPYRPRGRRGDGRVVVTFAGRYVPKKGALDAARALAQARGEVPDLVVRFVGHGPQEAELRSLLAELGLDAELLEGSAPGAVRAALSETDLLLTASRTADDGDAETLGLVNLEAHALGAPVITTTSGGIPEAVCADAAVLVPEGDVTAMAQAVVRLATAPESWAGRGRAGRVHVERRFDLHNRTAELEALWLALLRETSPTRGPVRR